MNEVGFAVRSFSVLSIRISLTHYRPFAQLLYPLLSTSRVVRYVHFDCTRHSINAPQQLLPVPLVSISILCTIFGIVILSNIFYEHPLKRSILLAITSVEPSHFHPRKSTIVHDSFSSIPQLSTYLRRYPVHPTPSTITSS